MTYAAMALGINVNSFPVVSGGTLSSDATYYYRTFTSNGTLSVTDKTLNVDVLVISGGASGGVGFGGGGGAGGVSQYLVPNVLGSKIIQVGGGGASVTGSSFGNGINGSLSSFDIYSTVGGGAGSGGTLTNDGLLEKGLNGGSGGGGAAWQTGNSPIAATFSYSGLGTSGQGNNGGRGWRDAFGPTTGGIGGGGGGGAGGAGQDGPIANGGSGTTAYSAWASATGTGVSNTYAGGGGGSSGYSTSGALITSTSGGSGGAGGGRYSGTAISATANTGSGGGAMASSTNTSGAGGSGIVIVRYLRSAVGG